MKYLFTVLLCAFAISSTSAQYSLVFCEDVDSVGMPKMAATAFMVSERGGMLRFMLRGDENISEGTLKYQIYFVNDKGNEEALTELTQKVESGWNYIWKEVVFFEPGNYRVKVFDGKESYLTSANLTIRRR